MTDVDKYTELYVLRIVKHVLKQVLYLRRNIQNNPQHVSFTIWFCV